MADVEAAVRDNFAALAVASTGKGKTVVALWLAATLGARVLVVTPNSEIMDNWRKETKLHLGVEAGVVQGDRCDYKTHNVCVAMIHSLAQRRYDDEFYQSFDLVVWDEVHVVGALTFSRTLGMFNSTFKLGLTATPRRKDGAEALFLNYFGDGYASQKEKALPADCYTIRVKHEPRKWPGATAILLKIITESKTRNAKLSRWIKWLYDDDRHVLGLSDRIEQLEAVRDILIKEHGIPARDIGIVAGQRTIGTKTLYKNPKKVIHGKRYFMKKGEAWREVRVVMRLPRSAQVALCDNEDAAPVTVKHKELFISYEAPVRRLQTQEENRLAKQCRIILATYGKFSMGANVPRLDAGIDLSPRATGEQQIGRIRRKVKGKRRPLWITPIDVGIAKFEGFAEARIREYRMCNVTVTPYAKVSHN